MIYTVTFNPSLDYVVQADQLIPGEINRTTSEHIYPGGKGNTFSTRPTRFFASLANVIEPSALR